MSAVCGPVQSGLAVVAELCIQSDTSFKQVTDHAAVPVLAGPGKAIPHLLPGGVRFQTAVWVEEALQHIKPPHTSGSFKVKMRATAGKEGRRLTASVGEAADYRLMFVS